MTGFLSLEVLRFVGPLATGFDFEPLPDRNVLIEFFGDDGKSITKQIVTAEVIRRMPFVAALLDVALREGPEVARKIVARLNRRSSEERRMQ